MKKRQLSAYARNAIEQKRKIENIRQEIINVWRSIGTLCFDTFEELAMMLNLPNTDIVKLGFDKIKNEPNFLFVVKNRTIYLDYIPF
jgi:hypothetical protein